MTVLARGYITSSKLKDGGFYPQSIQNLIIRDYCSNKKLEYRLSAAEYNGLGFDTFLVLKDLIVSDACNKDHLVFFSLTQLPSKISEAMSMVTDVLNSYAVVHFALERLEVSGEEHFEKLRELLFLKKYLPSLNKI